MAEGDAPAFLAESDHHHDDGDNPGGGRQGKAVVAAPARRDADLERRRQRDQQIAELVRTRVRSCTRQG